jgi:hypothetical protein
MKIKRIHMIPHFTMKVVHPIIRDNTKKEPIKKLNAKTHELKEVIRNASKELYQVKL